MFKRRILMLPGPNEPYPEILELLHRMVMPHYGDEWSEVYIETCNELKRIFQTKGDVLIYTSSGASAVGWVVSNLVNEGDRVIIVRNGFFGELLERKVRLCGGRPIIVESEFGKAVDPDRVRKVAKENRDARIIFTVYGETSAGVLNPVREIGEVAEETGRLLVVDAISVFGGVELKMDEWHIDLCIGYASKCMGSIPMLVPIAFNEEALKVSERVERVFPIIPNLKAWRELTKYNSISKGAPVITPISTSTLNIIALREAVRIALSEGLDNRYRRHITAGRAMREGVRAIGLRVLPDEADALPTVTAIVVPEGMDVKIRKLMVERFNILIGRSIRQYGAGWLLRVGHMGLTASPEFVIPTIYALEQVLMELGFKLEEESGVSAALDIFKNYRREWIEALLARYRYKNKMF